MEEIWWLVEGRFEVEQAVRIRQRREEIWHLDGG